MSSFARFIARIVAWFRPRRRPALQSVSSLLPPTTTVEVEREPHVDHHVALSEQDLFEAKPTPEQPESEQDPAAPNESGVHLRALRNTNETRRVPALATRISPFDAPTVRVDLDDLARRTGSEKR